MRTFYCSLFFAILNFTTSAQIVFNGSTTKSGSGVGSLTFAKTIAAGNDLLLIVGVTAQDKAISGVSWAGMALTQFTIGTRNNMRVALYYLTLGNRATSTTSNVVVTFAANTDAFAGAADYSGVYQPSAFVNPTVSQAKSTTPSITFTSAAGHKAVGLLGDISASPTANGAGQTQYWTFTGSHSNRATEKNGAASVTLSHTLSANEDWVMVGGTMQDKSVILPVELIDFSAVRVSKTEVQLNWHTASEKNNRLFLIERTIGGDDWVLLDSLEGGGTRSEPREYSVSDKTFGEQLTLLEESSDMYYRLTQVDTDGNRKVFKTVLTTSLSENELEMVVYPNPLNSETLNIHIDHIHSLTNGRIMVISALGVRVYEQPVILVKGDNNFALATHFPKGFFRFYWLVIVMCISATNLL